MQEDYDQDSNEKNVQFFFLVFLLILKYGEQMKKFTIALLPFQQINKSA